MKTIFKKLKNKAGESLVESLAAILIFTMASIVMYTMVTAAGDINSTAKQMDAENQAHMVAVEKGEPEATNGTADITFTLGSQTIAEQTVDIYGGEGGSLFTYLLHTEPTTPAGG